MTQDIQPTDAVLVLGNRAYLNGAPNPCLTGRVDKAVELAQAGKVGRLFLSGGMDVEDGRIEAQVMAEHARAMSCELFLEEQSLPILQAAGAKNMVIVSEPYHAWRIERLVRANTDYQNFNIQYAAAPTYCWNQWGMAFKGALREPVAIMNNWIKGYF